MWQSLASFVQATAIAVRFVEMMSVPRTWHVNTNEQVKAAAVFDIVVYLEKESDSDLEPFLGPDDMTTRGVPTTAVEKVPIEVPVPVACVVVWRLEYRFDTDDLNAADNSEEAAAFFPYHH
jgi:hypothetical protein